MLRRQAAPGTVLWVGGMERGTSEDAIRAAFAEWGVEAVRLPDGGDAATKGFAFLTFPTPEKARAALGLPGCMECALLGVPGPVAQGEAGRGGGELVG